ncbi:MAG: tRNA(His) guanylyltransferase Thg1 family protein [Planctomycetota bacterium]
MKFDDLDKKMRVYETVADYCVLPEMFIVTRLDGRNFTRLTKKTCDFDRPFDSRFRDLMADTAASLMTCGFKVIYAYTESDEISLLFDRDEMSFARKLRKINSIMAGHASAVFSLGIGQPAVFDCRVCQLPSTQLVVDYFRWRNEDAARNALSAWCYWTLRDSGRTQSEATVDLVGLSTAEKNELLYKSGVNFNDLPAWQKRGVGLFWESFQKESMDPRNGRSVTAARRRISRNFNLPMKDEYSEFVRSLVTGKDECPDNRHSLPTSSGAVSVPREP